MTISAKARSKLDVRDAKIATWRRKGRTQQQLADKFELSKSRIIQILNKTKKPARRRAA